MNKKKILYSIAGIAIVLFVILLFSYNELFTNNIKPLEDNREIFIKKENGIDYLFNELNENHIVENINSLKRWASILKFNNNTLKTGRYLIQNGMSNYQLITKFRTGRQDPIRLAINSVRDIYQLSGKLSHALNFDSLTFLQYVLDSNVLNDLKCDSQNVLSLFIPNTYEVYWTIPKEKLISKFQSEANHFWSANDREIKIKEKNLNKKEVYTLASIVEKETNVDLEKKDIAGVYINRLKSGMRLQADPTVVYALGLTGIQRVLFEHLQTASPYNTYMVDGLPPGPICMPSISSLDAVIYANPHDYIFFCAKPGYDGSHSFAKNLSGHYQNAKIYRDWLNKEKIK